MTDVIDPSLDLYVKAALKRKVVDLIMLDVRELTSVADVFMIASGRSNRQVIAIAENIQRDLKDHKIKPIHVEGKKDGLWVLMDYGHVVIHIFHDPVRKFYDLEGLWTDAPRIKTESLITAEHHRPENSAAVDRNG